MKKEEIKDQEKALKTKKLRENLKSLIENDKV